MILHSDSFSTILVISSIWMNMQMRKKVKKYSYAVAKQHNGLLVYSPVFKETVTMTTSIHFLKAYSHIC